MRLSIVVVVFVALLTVFAAYAVVYAQGLTSETSSTVTVGTYSLDGSYNYLAALKPNQVYNATTLSQGEGTLFVAITKSINVTYTFTVLMSQQGDVNVGASCLVTLSGGMWNKTLDQSSTTMQATDTNTATLSMSHVFNVTQIVALAKQIGAELQYATPSYVMQVRPTVSGSLVEAGRTVPVYFVAPLNLTVANGVISPSGVSHVRQGNITSVLIVTNGSTYTYRYVFYAILGASLVLLGLNLFYVFRIEKKKAPPTADDVTSLTQPYREVIATTTSLPEAESRLVMEKWEDLVKVADTMGKPIFEFVDRGDGFTHHVYWVQDGNTTYLFEATSKPKWSAQPFQTKETA